jgi:hypothetical protein
MKKWYEEEAGIIGAGGGVRLRDRGATPGEDPSSGPARPGVCRLVIRVRFRAMTMELRNLSEQVAPTLRRFGVVRAGVFGSVARGEARPESDLALLLEFFRAGPYPLRPGRAQGRT